MLNADLLDVGLPDLVTKPARGIGGGSHFVALALEDVDTAGTTLAQADVSDPASCGLEGGATGLLAGEHRGGVVAVAQQDEILLVGHSLTPTVSLSRRRVTMLPEHSGARR